MFVRFLCGSASAWCALEQAALDEVGLGDFFDSGFFFACGCRDRVESYRSAAEFFDDDAQYLTVALAEAELVDAEEVESFFDRLLVEVFLIHLRVVAAALEEIVRCAGSVA